MQPNYAKYLLEKVRKDYNFIAEDFSRTRGKIWEELDFLGKYANPGEKILDLGCGNGRLYGSLKDKNIDYYGLDFSEKLIAIARNIYPQARFQAADAFNLPFPDDFFDNIFSLAVFHHIPSDNLRLAFLKESRRVLKKDGRLIMTVWGMGGAKRIFLFLKYALLKIFGRTKLDFGDALVPWRNQTMRYVHYFRTPEIKKIIQKSGLLLDELKIIKRPNSSEQNIFVVCHKPS